MKGTVGPEPVFIGGCPRSGTTLVGSLLGAHPKAVCVPESQFKIAWIQSARSSGGTLDRDEALGSLGRDFRSKPWHLDRSELSRRLGSRIEPAELITQLVISYAERVGHGGAARWIDHTPNNIRYFAQLAETFPTARFVHLVRDPRAVAASLKPLDWGPNHSQTCATFWLQQISFGLAAEASLGERIHRIRYEDLVERPESTMEPLCRFLGLDFSSATLQGDGFAVPRYTRSQHRLVGQPPARARAHAWEQALSKREIELVETACCDLLPYFGYSPATRGNARPISRMERLSCQLQELVRAELVNPWRLRRRRRLIDAD